MSVNQIVNYIGQITSSFWNSDLEVNYKLGMAPFPVQQTLPTHALYFKWYEMLGEYLKFAAWLNPCCNVLHYDWSM